MNVLILEDETDTANLLREMIDGHPDFTVVEHLESVVDTVSFLSSENKKIDLMFFDIQLADGFCFEVFKHVDVSAPVIFCTAFDEYPFQAIKNNGIDYILKPFKDEDITQALSKYMKLFGSKSHHSVPILPQMMDEKEPYQQNFLVQYRHETIVKHVDDVAIFSIENDQVYLYSTDGRRYAFFKTLEYVESVCDPTQFFRVNRGMLVNRNAVKGFEPIENRKIALSLFIEVPFQIHVSRLKVSAFKKWLRNGKDQ